MSRSPSPYSPCCCPQRLPPRRTPIRRPPRRRPRPRQHGPSAGQGRAQDGPTRPQLRARVVGTLEESDVARAINKHGDVTFRTGQGEPVVWNAVTGKQRALTDAPIAMPTDIADDGRVVGVQSGQGVVLWNADGTVTPLGLPPGETSAGMARLGEDGTLLVTASHQFISRPGGHPRVATSYYRWRPETGFQHLSGPGDGSFTAAPALNDKGLVVGWRDSAGTAWRPDGTEATYSGSVPGTTRTWLHGVNNNGVAVGWRPAGRHLGGRPLGRARRPAAAGRRGLRRAGPGHQRTRLDHRRRTYHSGHDSS